MYKKTFQILGRSVKSHHHFSSSARNLSPDGEMSFLIKFSACSLHSLQNFINSIKVWNVVKCIQSNEMPRKKKESWKKWSKWLVLSNGSILPQYWISIKALLNWVQPKEW